MAVREASAAPAQRWHLPAIHGLLLLLFTTAVVLTLPSAMGQPMPQTIHREAEVEPVEGPIVGGEEPVTVSIQVHIRCEAPSVVLLPLEIEHRLESSSDGVSVALSESSHTITTKLQECFAVDADATYEVEAMLALPKSIPAYEDIDFLFYTTLDGAEELTATWTQQAAFQGEVIVDAYPETLWIRTDERDRSEAQAINRANAPITVQIELESAPEYGNVTFPRTVTVPYTPTEVDLTPFDIEYERLDRGTDHFTLRFIPSPMADPDQEMVPSSLTFRVEDADSGVETEDSPGAPILTVVLAAIAAAAFSCRRRRRF